MFRRSPVSSPSAVWSLPGSRTGWWPSPAVCRQAKPWFPTAACSCNSPIPSSRRKSNDRQTGFFRAAPAISHRHRVSRLDDLRRTFLSEAAHRCLPRSIAAARGDHYAVARTRLRGGGTAGIDTHRNRDERNSAARLAALDLALRAFLGADEFRLRSQPLFRTRAGVRTGGQCDSSLGAYAVAVAAVQSQRT